MNDGVDADVRFGRYRLESLLGRGGMGEVYRAFDTERRRTVAVKLLPASLSRDSRFERRFRRESELAARLRDPHIIPIHDFGEIDGRLYIDMRLVEGRDLASVIDADSPLSVERAVRLVGQVASALDAAHADGLVHRDVKPSNVLVSSNGDDFAYLIDFGIVDGMLMTGLTSVDSLVGTPAYMAPERFATDLPADHRVDVYSLGCLLFELLTGEQPFRGDGPMQLMHAHLSFVPPRPSVDRVDVPVELDSVVGRAMAKDPRARFGSAGELAAAARDALEGNPTHRTTGPGDAVTRPSFRSADEVPAPSSEPSGRGAGAKARVRGKTALSAGIGTVVAAGLVSVALVLTAPGASSPEVRSDPAARIKVAASPVDIVATPDGRRLYTANSEGNSVSVVDVPSRSVVATVPVGAAPAAVAVSPDGRQVYAVNERDSTMSIIDPATEAVVRTVRTGRGPKDVAGSVDGRFVYTANYSDSAISVIDARTGAIATTVRVDVGPSAITVSPDGRTAYVASIYANTVTVVDLGTSRVTETLPSSETPTEVAVSPDGRRAYVANYNPDSLSVLDTASGSEVATIPVPGGPSSVAVSPDGEMVLVTSSNGSVVTVVDTSSNAVVESVPVGAGPTGIVMTGDGKQAYTADYKSGSVSVLDLGG